MSRLFLSDVDWFDSHKRACKQMIALFAFRAEVWQPACFIQKAGSCVGGVWELGKGDSSRPLQVWCDIWYDIKLLEETCQ